MTRNSIAIVVIILLSIVGCKEKKATVFPNLFKYQNGYIGVVHIEDDEIGSSLILNNKAIANGENWVVNWADFPSVVEYSPGKLAAHYLVMKDPDVFAYDVKMILSNDEGQTWSSPITPHTDNTLTEHGFVSMVGVNGNLLAIWLDGRGYSNREDRMELRGALISDSGVILANYLIDENVCSCCGTEIASNDKEVFLVYRDRYEGEMRDMSLVKFDIDSMSWGKPKRINPDGWSIATCPVNGPAIDCSEGNLIITWYTELNDIPVVYTSSSTDSGNTFSKPKQVNIGHTLGRVDVSYLRNGSAAISFMESDKGEDASICIRRISSNGQLSDTRVVGETSSSRASGFPKIKNAPDKADALILSYTKVYNSDILPEVVIEQVDI